MCGAELAALQTLTLYTGCSSGFQLEVAKKIPENGLFPKTENGVFPIEDGARGGPQNAHVFCAPGGGGPRPRFLTEFTILSFALTLKG